MQNDVEHQLCKIFYRDFCKVYPKLIPYMTVFPAHGLRNKIVAAKLKQEGLTRGWPDYQLMLPAAGWHGLFLEFKTNKGTVSEYQKIRMEALHAKGYAPAVVRGSAIALEVIELYLAGKYFPFPSFEYKKSRLKDGTNRKTKTV